MQGIGAARAVATLLCALAAMAVLALGSTAASATTTQYCNQLVAPMTACPATFSGVANRNVAQYPGSGTVSVCERVNEYNGLQISRRCANNYVDSALDLCPYTAIDMTLYAGNNSSFSHTIWGFNVVGGVC
ncbi:MAG: hypothetical protein ACTHOE_00440 [Conexibacter sp.]